MAFYEDIMINICGNFIDQLTNQLFKKIIIEIIFTCSPIIVRRITNCKRFPVHIILYNVSLQQPGCIPL